MNEITTIAAADCYAIPDAPKFLVTDDFTKAAAILKRHPALWGVLVRNADTIRLHEIMMRLLKRRPVDEIIDYAPVNGEPPLYIRALKRSFLDMAQPLSKGEKDPSFRMTGQSWRSTAEEIGMFHTDPAGWILILSTFPTTRIAVQKTSPSSCYSKLYTQDDILRRDRTTTLFEPVAGTSVILRGMGADTMTAFHEIPRCPQRMSRLCLAVQSA